MRVKITGCYPGGSLFSRTFKDWESAKAWAAKRNASIWTAEEKE